MAYTNDRQTVAKNFANLLARFFNGQSEKLIYIVKKNMPVEISINIFDNNLCNCINKLCDNLIVRGSLDHNQSVVFIEALLQGPMYNSQSIRDMLGYLNIEGHNKEEFHDAACSIDPDEMKIDNPHHPRINILDYPIAEYLNKELERHGITIEDIERMMPAFENCYLDPNIDSVKPRFKIGTCYADLNGDAGDNNLRKCDIQWRYIKSKGQMTRIHQELEEIGEIRKILEGIRHNALRLLHHPDYRSEKFVNMADVLTDLCTGVTGLSNYGATLASNRNYGEEKGAIIPLRIQYIAYHSHCSEELARVLGFCQKRAKIENDDLHHLAGALASLITYLSSKKDRVMVADAERFCFDKERYREINSIVIHVDKIIIGLHKTAEAHNKAIQKAIKEKFSKFDIREMPGLVKKKQSEYAHNDEKHELYRECKVFRTPGEAE